MRFREWRIGNGELLELRIENGKWRISRDVTLMNRISNLSSDILGEIKNLEFDLEVGDSCGL